MPLYTCVECVYETTDKSNFNRHLISRRHLIAIGEIKKVIKIHQCNVCPFSTKYKSNYNVHMKRHECQKLMEELDKIASQDNKEENETKVGEETDVALFINSVEKYSKLSHRIKKVIGEIKQKLSDGNPGNLNLVDEINEIEKMPVEYHIYNVLADLNEKLSDF